MSKPTNRQLKRLRALALLRAAGSGWAAVAEKTGWSARRCETLANRFPAHWQRLLLAVLRSRALEAVAEGLAILRVALREGDWRARRSAAVGLFLGWRAVAPRGVRKAGRASGGLPANADVDAIVAFLDGRPDTDVNRVIGKLAERVYLAEMRERETAAGAAGGGSVAHSPLAGE